MSRIATTPVNAALREALVLDDIGPERVRKRQHYGSWVAGPVVRRIVEDALPYLNVPSDIEQNPVAQQ